MRKWERLSAVILLSVGCATAGQVAQPSATVKRPEVVNLTQMPPLQAPAGSRVEARIEMQMWIDETGKPEIETFRATGPWSDVNQQALREWLGSMQYRPAMQDGHPVRGLFTMILAGRMGGA